jgi:YHS domain-containing protein
VSSGLSSLLWFGLIAVVFSLMMRGGCGAHVMGHRRGSQHDDRPEPGSARQPTTAAGPAVDPVCGMQVDPVSSKSSVYRGAVYFFCSAEHRDAFEADPERYLKNGSVPATTREEHVHV